MGDFEKRQNREELRAILQSWLQACERLKNDDADVLRFWTTIRSRCDVYVQFLSGGRDGR